MKEKYKYDAFISYRQILPDKKIADKLHRELERYKVPSSLVKEGYPKKLTKVFKDIEELSASPDLSNSIYQALEESKFLIVVCSTKTKESKWVEEEVKTFIKLGKRDKILILLVDGEVQDVIPKVLLDNDSDPLAADIRDLKNNNPSLKKLKNVKLKLIAPILGCEYDELYQRQKRHDTLFLLKFSISLIVFLLIVAVVLSSYSIALDKSNKELIKTNNELHQSILETSAIYVQFLLTSQDDYTKWQKATSKVIDIIDSNNIEKAIKANSLLAKYISVKGYNIKDDKDIIPFFENPQYFLKSMFFRKSKFTTSIIEDRYLTLFLLDELSFPAKLFLFFTKPNIKMPDIYYRMDSVMKKDLSRYGYFYKAIYYESIYEHKKALEYLDKAAEKGFFHSLTGVLSPVSLDSMYNDLYIFDDSLLKEFHKESSTKRFMNEKEKQNLVKHLNLYFLLTISYSKEKQEYVKIMDTDENYVSLWIKKKDSNYGKVSYLNFVEYLTKNLEPKNNELKSFIDNLKKSELTQNELKDKENYEKALDKLNKELKDEILKLNTSKSEEIFNSIKEKVDKKVDNSLNDVYLIKRDIREIDELLSKLSEESIEYIKVKLSLELKSTSIKELRIKIAMKIRPYSFHVKMYDKFILDDNISEILKKVYKNEPNNEYIKFALKRYYKLTKNKRFDIINIGNSQKEYFKSINNRLDRKN